MPQQETQNTKSLAPQTETPSPARQAALDNLRRLNEAVERFGQEVKNGTIAPPTSAGRWK